jgi:hypothetical protein
VLFCFVKALFVSWGLAILRDRVICILPIVSYSKMNGIFVKLELFPSLGERDEKGRSQFGPTERTSELQDPDYGVGVAGASGLNSF